MSFAVVRPFVGVAVVVELDRDNPDTGETSIQLEGRVIRAADEGFAIQTSTKTIVVEYSELLDIERKEGKRRKVLVRYLRHVTSSDVVQHLSDRHGLYMDILNSLDEEAALEYHNRLDHEGLGHRHGERPRRRGNKSNATEAGTPAAQGD